MSQPNNQVILDNIIELMTDVISQPYIDGIGRFLKSSLGNISAEEQIMLDKKYAAGTEAFLAYKKGIDDARLFNLKQKGDRHVPCTTQS